jgi:DNA-dependent protein kinase catalytic subunit
MGINYLPVAENALNSLEYWFSNINLDKLKPYYPAILNKFDDYLQINRLGSLDETRVEEKILTLKLNYKGRGRKKLPVKIFEKNINSENSDLYEQIQVRILKILGQLAGEMSHCLFDTNLTDQIISWDVMQHLKFYVPFVDMKPAIYFDKFLPRIIYLSLSSANRQTKVNACELLHSIVVYMIGKSVADPVTSSSMVFQMSKIYKNIYPALFRLACDVDHFARNLFQPLVMQMIHWFTGNRKYESLETIELLNCIIESLIDEKDASLRDFSALALREFLKWSIKHTPLSKQEGSTSASPVNVKSILKRIFNFLTHPNRSKRLGAALAWNSIYTIFREEEVLVNKHIFELLYYLIESLALAEKDDKMFGTQEQTKLALDHVERIISTKKELLNQVNEIRVKPPGWTLSVLEVAVRWLLRQCGRVETECRHKAMDLVFKLTPCISGIKETKEYFKTRLESDSEAYFLARFEGSAEKKEILKESLCNFRILTDLGTDHFQLSHIQTWLGMLIAPLDCYTWVFGQRLLTPKDLFEKGRSCIWVSLQYFIDKLLNFDLVDVIQHVYFENKEQKRIVCTPSELEDFRKAKCTALIRCIDFLCCLIGMYPSDSLKLIPDSIWCEAFFTSIVNMCLDPQIVGFNLNDLEVYTNLPVKTRAFLKFFTQHMPVNVQDRLKNVCIKLIDGNNQFQSLIENIQAMSKSTKSNSQYQSQTDNVNSSSASDWLKLSQLVNGYEQLSEFNLYNVPLDLNRIIFDYINESSNYSNNYEQESLSCAEAKRKLLNLCLSLNYMHYLKESRSGQSNSTTDYLIEILDRYLFQNDKKILSFYTYYKNEICTFICKRHDSILKYILNKLKLNFNKCMNLIISLIEYLATDKQLRKTYGTKVVHLLYENWSLFRDFWQSDCELENKLLLVTLLTKTCFIELIPFDSNLAWTKQISEMYMNLLIEPKTELNFKCKLLDLLYVFCDSPSPYQIKNYLSQFITQFPLKSSELVKGEDAYNDYLNAIRKILVSLELSSSFDLVDVMVKIFCREAEHICDDEIQSSFVHFITKLDSAKQASIINVYWDNSFKNPDSKSEERKFITFKKVLLIFLTNCDKPVYMEFMCSNIMYLMSIFDVELKESGYESNALNKKV